MSGTVYILHRKVYLEQGKATRFSLSIPLKQVVKSMSQSQSHPGLLVLTLMGQGQNKDPDKQKCVLILLFGDMPISVIFNQLY